MWPLLDADVASIWVADIEETTPPARIDSRSKLLTHIISDIPDAGELKVFISEERVLLTDRMLESDEIVVGISPEFRALHLHLADDLTPQPLKLKRCFQQPIGFELERPISECIVEDEKALKALVEIRESPEKSPLLYDSARKPRGDLASIRSHSQRRSPTRNCRSITPSHSTFVRLC